jgi:hypothetical protein
VIPIYDLIVRYDPRYAFAGLRGPWICPEPPPLCPECGHPREVVGEPLTIEWEPGSSLIPDFSHPGPTGDLVVTDRVKDHIERRFPEVKFGPVRMIQKPRLRRPRRSTGRMAKRVWLPYEGPPLWRMNYTVVAEWDFALSGIKIKRVCKSCGTSRLTQRGDVVPEVRSVKGANIFGIRWWTMSFLLVERAMKSLREKRFTNVRFKRVGFIP